jgi:hypothetical protein
MASSPPGSLSRRGVLLAALLAAGASLLLLWLPVYGTASSSYSSGPDRGGSLASAGSATLLDVNGPGALGGPRPEHSHLGQGAESAERPYSLVLQPGDQGPLDLGLRLPEQLGHHGPAPAWPHEVPHGRGRQFTPTLVGRMSVIGHEMKMATAIMDAALLDFIGAHREAQRIGNRGTHRRRVHARGAHHRMRRGSHAPNLHLHHPISFSGPVPLVGRSTGPPNAIRISCGRSCPRPHQPMFHFFLKGRSARAEPGTPPARRLHAPVRQPRAPDDNPPHTPNAHGLLRALPTQ